MNIVEIIMRSIGMMSHELSNYELDGADYILKIVTKDISLLDVSKIDELYKCGYWQTKNKICKIKNAFYDNS